jgi:hypothetical protein
MKIIQEGKLPEQKVYHAECNYCHTIVEFQLYEAIKTEHTPRNEDYLLILCPLCSKQIWTEK